MKASLPAAATLLAVLASLGFLQPSAGDPGEEAATQRPTVSIAIVAEGDSIAADPDSILVRPGQKVEWSSELGDWEVVFESDEPFGEEARRRGIKGGKGKANGRNVRSAAREGRYKYLIRVTTPDGKTLERDPEIVVRPGRGDGG